MNETGPMLVIDAANVVGSRPDGWWRDRAGAARRFVDEVRAASFDEPVVVVLEGQGRHGVDEGDANGVRVVHAAREGDDAIVDIVRVGDPPVTVVSADRALAARVRALGAEVVGPRSFLDGLTADEVATRHQAAIDAGEPGYLDPDSGLFVFTAAYHLARGSCCCSGCRHCPYDSAS